MRTRRLFLLVLAFGAPVTALAQDVPAAATQHEEEVAAERPDSDELKLQLTAGASFAYGNARNFAVNLGGQFSFRQDEHSLLVEASWVYGLASTRIDPDMGAYGDYNENTNNLTGRARYDYFITPDDALFIAFRFRNDPFSNLEPRVGGQIGYLRNLFREENHRLWVELGVDGTYDNFGEPLAIGASTITQDRFIFSWRAFVGYSNELTEYLTYNTGLEVLGEIARAPGVIEPGHLRFEWVNQFRSKIEDWLQISLDVIARLDSQPAGQRAPWQEEPIDMRATEMFDLLTTLNLVGNFDLRTPPPATEEAAAEEPACPVCPVCEDASPCVEGEAGTNAGAGAGADEGADEGADDGADDGADNGGAEETPDIPDDSENEPEAL